MALVALVVGAVCTVTGAALIGGLPALVATVGVLLLALGLALAYVPDGSAPDGYRLVSLDDYDDAGQLVR